MHQHGANHGEKHAAGPEALEDAAGQQQGVGRGEGLIQWDEEDREREQGKQGGQHVRERRV